MEWTRKDLLGLYDLSGEEITYILDTAAEFKKVNERNVKKVPALRGKTVVNFFVEPSTRTRFSFASACNLLGLEVQDLDEGKSQIAHGETVRETANMISFMSLKYIIRNFPLAVIPEVFLHHCVFSTAML